MPSNPRIIGHRGASRFAPENTLAAFRLALAVGADGVEFDVRLTHDGVPVIIHDDNLKRTGATPSRVADLTLAELQKIDVGSWFRTEGFAAERVPTLEQLFEVFRTTSSLLYLEMKSDKSERERLAQACVEKINTSSLKERIIVECFDLSALAIIKSLDPSIRTAALFEPGLTAPPLITSGQRLVDQALAVGAKEIALHHRLATDRVITTANNSGLTVVVWTVDDPSWIRRALSNGVTALITNDPAMMISQRDQQASD
jgi:glycerophosphoryl diester phosphodiesterase